MANPQYHGMVEAFDRAALSDPVNEETSLRLRTATVLDIPLIRAICGSATSKFEEIPELADLAGDLEEPLTIQQWLTLGRIYIAEQSGNAVGFIAVYALDNALYIQELSVLADHQGKGVGKFLITAVFRWALTRSIHDGSSTARVSLLTYADVPWNGPWYHRGGFREVDPSVIGPWHVQTADEDKQKLQRPGYRRCCMLWEVEPPPVASASGDG